MVYDCKPKAHFISKLEDKKVGALSKVLFLNKKKKIYLNLLQVLLAPLPPSLQEVK